jgi:hypothetical protein
MPSIPPSISSLCYRTQEFHIKNKLVRAHSFTIIMSAGVQLTGNDPPFIKTEMIVKPLDQSTKISDKLDYDNMSTCKGLGGWDDQEEMHEKKVFQSIQIIIQFHAVVRDTNTFPSMYKQQEMIEGAKASLLIVLMICACNSMIPWFALSSR